MNGEDRIKTNLGLNLGTLIALLIALIAGGVISADMYSIVQKIQTQNKANGDAVNQTLVKLVNLQQANNIRGNDTLNFFIALTHLLEQNTNQTLINQHKYFPQFNESLGKIFNALNITENSILGNLTAHRIISNQTHGLMQDLITNMTKQILNQTR